MHEVVCEPTAPEVQDRVLSEEQFWATLERVSRFFVGWDLDAGDILGRAAVAYLQKQNRGLVRLTYGYAYVLARHSAVDLVRRREAFKQTTFPSLNEPLPGGEEWGHDRADPGDFEAALLARETIEEVVRLAQWDPRICTVLPPYLYLSSQELGTVLGIGAEEAKALRVRARRVVRAGKVERKSPGRPSSPRVVQLALDYRGVC